MATGAKAKPVPKKPAAKGGGVLPGTTQFVYETKPAPKKPAARGGGVLPGTTQFVYEGQRPTTPAPTQNTTATQPTTTATSQQPAGDPRLAWEQEQAALALRQQQNNAIAAITGMFSTYGLSSLGGKITEYVKAGYTGDTIAILLRSTPEYKARFPAMEALAARGQAISEAEYIGYEVNARQLEQFYGLPKGMVTGQVATLLTNSVSADELNTRASMAAANAMNAPQAEKDKMAAYYGIGQGGLTAYFLDPDIAVPLLQKQAAAARLGASAGRQGIDIGSGLAEDLYGRGVSVEQADRGFQTVSNARGFQYGRGETATQDEMIAGAFGDAQAAGKMNRIAASRTGRFDAGGQFAANRDGMAGLGRASR